MSPKVPRGPSVKLLESLDPAVQFIESGSILWRIYFRGGRHPTRWNDFRHVGPVDARFDHHVGEQACRQDRAVIYAADDPTTCLAEAFQKTRVIHRWHNEPWLVAFKAEKAVRLLDLTGSFATRAGASMGLMTGPRSVGRNWSRAFYDTYVEIEGLWYPSSMHANRPAIVLNDRAEAANVLPRQPTFHRALGDPALLTFLKNAARTLGYALG